MRFSKTAAFAIEHCVGSRVRSHGMTSKEDADRRQAAKVLYDLQMGLLWEANMSELNNYDEKQD